ncbi:two-component sensor histidine kinase [Pseudooceanicola sp. 216_PA32_1]|uniref:histidine kinase n=1 Tax=Pseudooceanicola pacificus TaxID=2676438 RepID=A0A844W2Q8_9RHOB|nr:ATP-binding protein [Pseudooceanicola pacificus]MWB77375.1 two-component sensor histidine kinase [Pseudooceanicola pacificus]
MPQDTIDTLLRALPLAAVIIGRNERIVAANRRATELLGHEIQGRHFITAIRQPAVLDAVEACFADRQDRQARFLTNDGAQDTTFVVHCAFFDTPIGTGVLVSFEDVTHVEQAGQMRRDFVANVSHELRTPLTALLGFIETLRGPARNDEAARDRFLGIMAAEAERMERLVKDLLSLSRVESEERMRPTARVDLSELTASVLNRLDPLASSAHVALRRDLPATPVVVPGDEDQLRQVLTNLIENAIKYGGAGGEVSVTLTRSDMTGALRGPGASIVVADKGPGIDLVHLPRLTERFYRVDSHRSREMGGTGLGLAIVKHIVNRHRGRLRIDSEPGEGSRFSVILPSL